MLSGDLTIAARMSLTWSLPARSAPNNPDMLRLLIAGVLNQDASGSQAKVQALEDQVQTLQERLKELEMERAHNTAQLDLLGKCAQSHRVNYVQMKINFVIMYSFLHYF